MTPAAATLRERIEQAPNTAALLALIDSLDEEDRAQSWVLAAEHFPHVDGPFTAALLRAKPGKQESYVWAAPALTRNRHITRGQIDVVLGMIASELTTTTSADRARALSDAIQQFAAVGFFTLAGPSAGRLLLDHLANAVGRPATLRLATEAALDAFLSAPDVSGADLARAGNGLIGQPSLLARLLAHPAADQDLWHLILRAEFWTGSVLEILVEDRRARRDPEVRRVLTTYARWKDHAMLERLARSARGREFAAVLDDLIRCDPERAVRALARARPGQRRAVRPKQLLPLLESDNRQIRLAAQTALGGTGRPVPGNAPPRR